MYVCPFFGYAYIHANFIVNKSIYTSPSAEPTESPVDVSPIESPELYALQLSYPPPEEPTMSRFLDQQKVGIQKYEGFPEHFSMGAHATMSSIPNDSVIDSEFPSPVDSVVTTSSSSSSPSAFPLFSGEASNHREPHTIETHPWAAGADLKSNEVALENFNILASYEAIDQGESGVHNYPENVGLDFNIYDNYGNFQGMPDDTLASMAEHYI